ncbi:MAG: HNH endonuclease [Chloroflexota bacterium]|nr:HNH endonuclease [Chloroflexota bacterium]
MQRRRHATQRRENWQQWYAKNRQRLRAEQHATPRDPGIARRWRERNPQYVLAMREWKRNKPDAVRTHKIARRVRLLGNSGSHTAQKWREKIEVFAGCCVYCGEARPLIRDHNIPLVRGGTNDIGNILPACRRCNNRKYTMTAREYIAATAA